MSSGFVVRTPSGGAGSRVFSESLDQHVAQVDGESRFALDAVRVVSQRQSNAAAYSSQSHQSDIDFSGGANH